MRRTGKYWIAAFALCACARPEHGPVTAAAPPPRANEIPPSPTGSIRGRVTSEGLGQPVEAALVIVTRLGRQGGEISFTNEDGRYEVVGLPPAEYVVTFHHGVHRTTLPPLQPRAGTPSDASGAVNTGHSELVAVLEGYRVQPAVSICGTVFERATGTGAARVAVLAVDRATGSEYRTMTDPSGKYQIGLVPSGRYDLTFSRSDEVERWPDVVVRDGGLTPVDVAIGRRRR